MLNRLQPMRRHFSSTSLTSVPHVKKFYKSVGVEPHAESGKNYYTVKLDKRSTKTPDGHKFFVPAEPLAHLVAMEFMSQKDYIVSSSLPLVCEALP